MGMLYSSFSGWITHLFSCMGCVEYGSCVRSLVQTPSVTKIVKSKNGSRKSMATVFKRNVMKKYEQRRVANMLDMLLKAAETIESDDIGEIQRKSDEAKQVHIKDARQLTQNNMDLIAHVLKDGGGVTSLNSECRKIVLGVNYKNARSIGAIDEELKEIP